jgi:hypothetical protein
LFQSAEWETFRKDGAGSPGAVPKLQRQGNPRPAVPQQEPRFEKSTGHIGSLMKKSPIQAVQKRLDARPPKS